MSGSFWITNVSKLKVGLQDLALYVKPYTSLDLLKGNYTFTEEQLLKSVSEGSIYRKRKQIKVRVVPPESPKVEPGIYVSKQMFIPGYHKLWSLVKIKEEIYEELDLEDDNDLNFVKALINQE